MKLIGKAVDYARKNRWALAVALAYTVAVYMVSPFYMPLFDSATYADIAKNIASGKGCLLVDSPTSDVPLFPVILAVFMLAFGSGWIPAYLSVASFLLVVSLFHLAEDLRKGSGIISVLILPTLALPVLLSLQALTDALFLVFVNVGVILLRKLMKAKTWKNVILLSAVVSSSYLLRPTGLFLIGFSMMACGWHLLRRRMPASRFLALVLIALLTVGGWEILGGKMTSSLEGIQKKAGTASLSFTLTDTYNGDVSFSGNIPIQAGNAVRLAIFSAIFVMPAMLLVFVLSMLEGIHPAPTKIPLEGGIVWKREADTWLLIIWIAAFLLPHLTVVPSFVARYMMPVLPPFIVVFANFLRRKWRKKPVIIAALVALHLATAWGAYQWYYPRTEHLTSRVFAESGRWVIENLPENATFVLSGMQAPEFHYYSGRLPVKGTSVNITTAENVSVNMYVIRSNLVTESGGLPDEFSMCKRFEDRFYWLEVWGRSCRIS